MRADKDTHKHRHFWLLNLIACIRESEKEAHGVFRCQRLLNKPASYLHALQFLLEGVDTDVGLITRIKQVEVERLQVTEV